MCNALADDKGIEKTLKLLREQNSTSTFSQSNVKFQKISIPLPQKGFFSKTPNPSRNSNQASYISLNFFGLTEPPPPPTPQEIPIPSVGGVWIFAGTAQCKIIEDLVMNSYIRELRVNHSCIDKFYNNFNGLL